MLEHLSDADLDQAREMMREAGWRIKRVRIPVRWMLTLLYQQNQVPHFVNLPDLRLPEGYKVVPGSLRAEPYTNCWEVLVVHPSFPEVPDGAMPPLFDADVRWQCYALATEAEMEARRAGCAQADSGIAEPVALPEPASIEFDLESRPTIKLTRESNPFYQEPGHGGSR